MVEPIDAATALDALGDWGFVDHATVTDGESRSWLAIAIHARPTLRHFDPEFVRYWTAYDGRGAPRIVDVSTSAPIEERFSWGPIRAVDRLHIANEWVSFGGRASVAQRDGAVVLLFTSDVPILRRGGHSQGWDHGAANVAAFFGRVKVAVDYVPGFEANFNHASPRARFAAFVADLAARLRTSPALALVHPDLNRLVLAEDAHLRRLDPEAYATGLALAADAGLASVPPGSDGSVAPALVSLSLQRATG